MAHGNFPKKPKFSKDEIKPSGTNQDIKPAGHGYPNQRAPEGGTNYSPTSQTVMDSGKGHNPDHKMRGGY